MTTVYIVIAIDYGFTDILSTHTTYEGAVAVWDAKRLEMIESLLERQRRWSADGCPDAANGYAEQIVELSHLSDPRDDSLVFAPRIIERELLP